MSGALEGLLIPFGLVLARVSGLLLALPVFSIEVTPIRFRAGMAIVLAITLSLSVSIPTPANLALATGLEVGMGLAMGFIVRIALSALRVAGEVTGMQMGFGFAQMTDPMTRESINPLTQLLATAGAAMFVALDGHLEVIRALALSLRRMPPGHLGPELAGWSGVMTDAAAESFIAGLRVGGPVIFVAFLSHICFGLLTRVAPQLNVWALGFLFTIGAGLIAMTLAAPVLGAELRNLVNGGVANLMDVVAH